MRWSLPIGRVFGISLRLHVTFLIFLAFIAYGGFVDAGAQRCRLGGGNVRFDICCIALHELGHSVVAQQLGVQVKSITLLPIGGVAALRSIPENPWHEIAITVAGPMVNAAIACALIPFTGIPSHCLIVDMPQDLHGLLLSLDPGQYHAVRVQLYSRRFRWTADGCCARCWRWCSRIDKPRPIAAMVGQGLAILFVLVGLKLSFWLVLIGVFIFMGAEGEERVVRMRSVLRDLDCGRCDEPGLRDAFAIGSRVARDRDDLSNGTGRFSRARRGKARGHRGAAGPRGGDECAGIQHAGA